MTEADALRRAGEAALKTVIDRVGAVGPALCIVDDPATWHAAARGPRPRIALSAYLAGRLADGVEFMGPNDPDVAAHWAARGLPEGGADALRRLVAPHRWSLERIDRSVAHPPQVTRLDRLTQAALCRAVGAGVPVIFTAPAPPMAPLATVRAVVTGTARTRLLGRVLEDPQPQPTARVALPAEVWGHAGAPVFGRAEFQFSQLLAGAGPQRIARDVLDDWISPLRGRACVDLWPPGAAQALSPLGAIASDQIAHPAAEPAPAQTAELHPGQWLVVPHGWFKRIRPIDPATALLRHYWRF